MKSTLVLSMAAALSTAGITHAAPQPGDKADTNACVFFSTIHDFRALDEKTLVIWAPSRRSAYLVEIGMPLPDLKWSDRLGFEDSNRDGRLCGFGMDRIIVSGSSYSQRSTITGMTALDDVALVQLEEKYGVELAPRKKETAKATPE